MSGRFVNHSQRDADEARDHNLARARHVAHVKELMGPRPTEIMAGIMYDLDYTALVAQKRLDCVPREGEGDHAPQKSA